MRVESQGLIRALIAMLIFGLGMTLIVMDAISRHHP